MKNVIFISLILLLSCQGNQEVGQEKIVTEEKEGIQDPPEAPIESDSAFIANVSRQATNQKDSEGFKQGWWIVVGKDFPEKGFPAEAKIEEGMYREDKKVGEWLYYNTDGTLQQKSNYTDGAFDGISLTYNYEKGVVTEMNFDMGRVLTTTTRPIDE